MLVRGLNFPLDIRAKTKSLLLVGIIPGQKEPKNLDPYLNILIDDISGHTLLHSFKDEHFTLKANILLHILDYPGQNKVFHCNG